MTDKIKPVIVITAFGTSAPEGLKDLEKVDRMVLKRYPDCEVRWVFTSGFISKKLKSLGTTTLFERKVPLCNLAEVYEELRREGKTDVVIGGLLTVSGSEYSDVVLTPAEGLNVEYNYPLLGAPGNIEKAARALAPYFGDDDTYTIICAHGNARIPLLNLPMVQLHQYVSKRYKNVAVVTIEGPPGTEKAFADARATGLKKAKFVPFLFAAGGHIKNDVMSDEPGSFKMMLGLEATNEGGLVDNEGVMALWLESIDWAIAKFSK
jgi:sirohydrochlorin cobaltochelatase